MLLCVTSVRETLSTGDHASWQDEARAPNHRLRPVEDATTVRRRGGKVLVTDGPFAESREWIVGIDVLECDDLDQAIAIAAEHPMAAGGRLELRPFWPFEE